MWYRTFRQLLKMAFEHFCESLEYVPPELNRNFTLMTELDKRSEQTMNKINEYVREYQNSKTRNERDTLRKKTAELFEKLNSFADDKIELALLTYELIDKNIKRLVSIGNFKDAPIGFDMPIDPNEPKYCICREASHGEMVACDNKECHIEWFHYACVGLRSAPKGRWYCGQCFNPSSAKKHKSRGLR